MLKVIGTNNCSKCLMVKNILNNKQIEYEYSNINDYTQEEQDLFLIKAKEVNITQFPLIFKENEIIDISQI